MLHTKFHGNRPTGTREDFRRVFYYIWAWRPSWSYDQHYDIKFSFFVPESFHTKFGSEWHNSLRKSSLNFCMRTTLGQGQDLDLQYSHNFINLIRCLILPASRSLTAIVLKNQLFSPFPMESPNYKI